MSKFLNNIPSLRGIINCTPVTYLWTFRNGWMAPEKREEERKLTETECNKTPRGQHIHQFRKHMERRTTCDTHVSQHDQRHDAPSGQNGSRTCPPYCGWNPTAHDFFCALANYEFITTISNIYMCTVTKLQCVYVCVCVSNGNENWRPLSKLKLDFHHSDLHLWLLILDCLNRLQALLTKLHRWDLLRHLLVVPGSVGAILA